MSCLNDVVCVCAKTFAVFNLAILCSIAKLLTKNVLPIFPCLFTIFLYIINYYYHIIIISFFSMKLNLPKKV